MFDAKDSRILIVDDEPEDVEQLKDILKRAGYSDARGTVDSRQSLALFESHQPDLLVLGLHMEHIDGFGIMRSIAPRIADDDFLPILILTSDATQEAERRALQAGASDYITKPLDEQEVLLRIGNLLHTRWLHKQLQSQNEVLEERVRERTKDLSDAQEEILHRLALAGEYRDDDTGEHVKRVSATAAAVAKQLGKPAEEVELIRLAAILHDVGKIGIADAVLLKPGKLTDEEFETMKGHTTMGGSILTGSNSRLLQLAEEVAMFHHERWDGTGYSKLQGESVPLVAQIVSIADVFDALTNERPYKKAWTKQDALAEIKNLSGKNFDPRVVEAFFQVVAPAS